MSSCANRKQRLKELSLLYGIDFFDPEIEQIYPEEILSLMIDFIPLNLCFLYQFLPLKMLKTKPPLLVIGMVKPDNLQLEDDLYKLTQYRGFRIKKVAILPDDFEKEKKLILQIIEKSHQRKLEEKQEKTVVKVDNIVTENIKEENIKQVETDNDIDNEFDLDYNIETSTIISLVNKILVKAIIEKAEEIYIKNTSNQLLIQFKKDGHLKNYFSLPIFIQTEIINRLKIMAKLDNIAVNSDNYGKFSGCYEGKKYEFIIHIIPSDNGQSIYIENLKTSEIDFKLENLFIDESTLNQFEQLIKLNQGLIVITGGRKTRKTVVSYATLNELVNNNYNIFTLENIVHYPLNGTIQTSVIKCKDQEMSSLFDSINSQNPDVIYINKLDDALTAKKVFSAVANGKLILAEMDFYNIENILFKFLDWGISLSEITLNLKAIINQRLIRKVCKNCCVSYNPSPEVLSLFKNFKWSNNHPQFYKIPREENLCNLCKKTGYQDMITVCEIMKITPSLQQLMLKPETLLNIRQEALKQGMKSLLFNGLILVEQGLTTVEEIQSVFKDFL